MICLILACFIYIGYSINLYYKNRCNFYKNLIDFLNIYENEITFNKNNIFSILANHTFGKAIDIFLNNYLNYNIIYPKYILESEMKEINNLLESLGKKDIDGEIQNLNNFKIKFEHLYIKCCDDYKKKGSISIKLSFVIGLLIAILLI